MIIVGICGGRYGNSGVGKTVAAKALSEALGLSFVSLMKPVRDMCIASGEELTPENLDEVCRRGRDISPDYWLNLALKEVIPDSQGVVLDDLWFETEASFVTSSGGLVVLVTRPGYEDDPHRDFTPCVTVNNDLTEEVFRDNVINIATRYLGVKSK